MASRENGASQESVGAIRIVLANLGGQQRALVQASLERANTLSRNGGTGSVFEFATVEGRGIHILKRAGDAHVVVLGLEDEVLPGEASHIVATYPHAKVIGVDRLGHARVVLGVVSEPLSQDLPTVIRWITRRTDSPGALHTRTH